MGSPEPFLLGKSSGVTHVDTCLQRDNIRKEFDVLLLFAEHLDTDTKIMENPDFSLIMHVD